MESVLRAIAVYLVLLILLRLTGKRALSQITTFDFVILLVVGEATQQALLGEDFSLTNAALVIAALLVLDRGADYLSWRFSWFQKATESTPVVLIDNGRPREDVMAKNHLSTEEIMVAARVTQGLERVEQIKWAVLETSGGISVVPWSNAPSQAPPDGRPDSEGGHRDPRR